MLKNTRGIRFAAAGSLAAAVLVGTLGTAASAVAAPAPTPVPNKTVTLSPGTEGPATQPTKPGTQGPATQPTKPGTELPNDKPKPVVTVPAAKAVNLTAKADRSSVAAWQQFRITGKATGLKAGTKLTVQQYQAKSKKWVSLPASTTVNKDGSYGIRVKLGLKGANKLRLAGGKLVSNTVNVTVR
ncbi:hypothetical protein ACH429_16055 [Streptomyces pathocidini]|uniref:Uncharacterized protein n=1 Tax=Streptomyces pathocidini TaxID=1650571 RepID=A0ABW7USL2_9ACTN|nr:hypothetical protein [Streptomyces pathocidini]